MIKKFLLTGITLFSFLDLASAQAYDWMTGGGSTESMTPSRNYERVTNMCTDPDGNVYITALTGATSILADTFSMTAFNTYASIPHILLASYTCNGVMRWAKLIESSEAAEAGEYLANSGLAYNNGSIYLVGVLYGDNKHIGFDTIITSTYLQSFTARFDTLGHFKWLQFVGTDTAPNEVGTGSPGAVAIDGQGYIHNFNGIEGGIHITPSIISTNGTYDLKYDSLGNLISATKVALDSVWTIQKAIFNKQDDKFYAVLLPNESYWFTYYTNENTALCAFQPDGSLIWMDSTGAGSRGVVALDYKGGNQIYVCGVGNSPDTFSIGGLTVADTFFHPFNIAVIARLDTNGVAKWIYDLQSNQSVDMFSDISILPDGKVAAVGYGGDTAIHGTDTITTLPFEYSNPILLITDTSGNTIKLDQAHGDGYDYGYVIASDAVGNVYLGGENPDSIRATGLSAYHSHGGNTDFFLLKYGYSCSCTAAPVAGFTYTGTTTVTFTYTGTTGFDSVKWTFGDGGSSALISPTHTYSTTGAHYACVTVYTSCGIDKYCYDINSTTGIETWAIMGNVLVYPNPVADDLVILHAALGGTIKIFNITGQLIYSGIVSSDQQQISTRNLLPGAYLLQITDVNGNRIMRTVAKE